MIARIGKGSMADEHGFSFDILVGWLEDIRNNEAEKAETKPRYQKRLDKLEDALQLLSEIQQREPGQ